MAFTHHEIKARLGYGAGKEIAQATERSEGHVSQVLNCKRSDPVVAAEVARRLRVPLKALPERYYREPAA